MFYVDAKGKKDILQEIAKNEPAHRIAEYFIYQQAYGLGERMFYDYIQGHTTKKEIQRLFTMPFNRLENPNFTLVKLKLKYWPPKDERIKDMVQGLLNKK